MFQTFFSDFKGKEDISSDDTFPTKPLESILAGTVKCQLNKENGILILNGEGAIPDDVEYPSDFEKNKIKMIVVESGILSIGSNVFKEFLLFSH